LRHEIEDTAAGIERALSNTHRLFMELSEKHEAGSWPILLGVENQPDPTQKTSVLGHTAEHFEIAMRGTPGWINFTVDTGHAKLSHLGIEDGIVPLARQMGKRIVDIHLHDNRGRQTESSHGDEHLLPGIDRLPAYRDLFCRAVEERIPVVLELSENEENNSAVWPVSRAIRDLMNRIENERLAFKP
jgi:sugar phosphate isomerase/epimerase